MSRSNATTDAMRSSPHHVALWRRTRAAVMQHWIVVLNTGYLTVGPAVAAVLGFAFWWLAARNFSPHEVGLATAAISAINVITLIASLSLGTTMMGVPLSRMPRGRGLVTAAAILSVTLTLLVFGIALTAASLANLDVLKGIGGTAGAVLVLIGAVFMVIGDLADGVLTSYMRNALRMLRETALPIARLVFLAAFLWLVTGGRDFVPIVATGIAAEFVSILLVGFVLLKITRNLWQRPHYAELAARMPTAASHHLLNLTSLGPAALMPLLVAEMLTPAVAAAFYPAWMVLQIVLLAPAGASTALFALGVREPDRMADRLRFSLAASLAISVAAAFVLVITLEPFLAFLNPAYPALGGDTLKFIGFGAVGMMLKHHYMAAMRFENRMLQATPILAIGGAAEIGGAALGAYLGGTSGLILGWLAGVHVLVLLTLPDLARVTGLRLPRPFARATAPCEETPRRKGGLLARCLAAFLIALMGFLALALPGTTDGNVDPVAPKDFVGRIGTRFVLNGAEFPVAGVNNHYLTFGSEQEVVRVLDDAVALGANVVRTFLQPVIGSLDGSTTPTIWDFHSKAETSNLGVNGTYFLYWDTGSGAMAVNEGARGLAKLDFLMAEAAKRDLKVILALLDFWSYTGGAAQMSAWYGSRDAGRFFARDPRTVRDYKAWAKHVILRTNTITGAVYRDDPTIFAWELMNEPNIRPARLLRRWVGEMAAHIKSLDPHHLVTTGHGNIYESFSDIEEIPEIDFGTWHGYPIHWNVSPEVINEKIGEFCAIAQRAKKPMLFSEFGHARSNPDHVDVYRMWLDTLLRNQDCAGWIVWRLVSRQDSGRFPVDSHDQFDIRNDGGALWQVLKEAAAEMRARSIRDALPRARF